MKRAAVPGWEVNEQFSPNDPRNALSTLVTFDVENEMRVVRSSLSPATAAFLDKTSPPEGTIRTAQSASRKMTQFYDNET